MVSDPLAVFFVLAFVVCLSIWLEDRFAAFRKLGAAMIGILLAIILSNTGFLPGQSPAYNFISGPGVSAGIVLILLGVNVRSILQAGPVMLKAFGIGAVGTIIGCVLMAFLLAPLVGPETWKLTGQYVGTYTGGGMNFAAIGKALGTSSDLFTAAIAADVIVTAIWLLVCLSAPVIFSRKQPDEGSGEIRYGSASSDMSKSTLDHGLYTSERPVRLIHIASLVAIAIGALWISGMLASWFSFFPKVLWLTTIALVLAQIPAVKKLAGSAVLGNYLLLLFLASNGAKSVVANIINVGSAVFFFAAGTVIVHGIFIFGVGRLFRINVITLAVASQANVGGAASAMALASARGYSDHFLPGMAAGLLGYAVGNYFGLGIAAIMKGML